MAAVKGAHTTPELALRHALYGAGVRGWRCHYKRAAGRPDIAWPALRVAVFVDGAFWHGHSSRYRPGRSGDYWDRKIATNVARDRRVDGELEASGWIVVHVWDFDVRKACDQVVAAVIAALARRVAETEMAPPWWPPTGATAESAGPRSRTRGRPSKVPASIAAE